MAQAQRCRCSSRTRACRRRPSIHPSPAAERPSVSSSCLSRASQVTVVRFNVLNSLSPLECVCRRTGPLGNPFRIRDVGPCTHSEFGLHSSCMGNVPVDAVGAHIAGDRFSCSKFLATVLACFHFSSRTSRVRRFFRLGCACGSSLCHAAAAQKKSQVFAFTGQCCSICLQRARSVQALAPSRIVPKCLRGRFRVAVTDVRNDARESDAWYTWPTQHGDQPIFTRSSRPLQAGKRPARQQPGVALPSTGHNSLCHTGLTKRSHIDSVLHAQFPLDPRCALEDDDLDWAARRAVEMEQHIVAWRHEQFSPWTSSFPTGL